MSARTGTQIQVQRYTVRTPSGKTFNVDVGGCSTLLDAMKKRGYEPGTYSQVGKMTLVWKDR